MAEEIQRLKVQSGMLTQHTRPSTQGPQESPQAELQNVKVSYTQKTEALLSSFCQQVAKADGHHPHHLQMPIFTLLVESGSRRTCCSPCSISASNTELCTETAGSGTSAHAHDPCNSTV